MNFYIDSTIFEQYPDLKIGAVLIKGLNNSKRVSNIESLLRGICAQKHKELHDKDLKQDPKLIVWDQAYGRFGINPNKFNPSITALLKRIQKKGEVPHINSLVDLYNYFSIKYSLPIGGEDIDWLCGDVRLTFTKGGEAFRPLGSIDVEEAKEGEIAYMDDGGITCRYWNHRECERTKFTPRTVNALLLIEDLGKVHLDEFGRILNEIQQSIEKYVGAMSEISILTEEKPSIELGVEGRRSADDSRVPMQEKAYYLQKMQK